MEIDGGRDGEIKRNMPLGVTEEGVRVMRGLQAQEPYTVKNNSTSFSISPSVHKPLLVGEINSRLVCLRLQEFAAVVECVFVCVSASFFFFSVCLFLFFCCRRKDKNFEVHLTPMGGAKSPHFLLIIYKIFPLFFFLFACLP